MAASLTAKGKQCSIVLQKHVTFERGFGTRVGRYFQDLLEARGAEIHGDDEVERFEGRGRSRRS